jgi:hypothetical protein
MMRKAALELTFRTNPVLPLPSSDARTTPGAAINPALPFIAGSPFNQL